MTDRFEIIPLRKLLQIILNQLDKKNSLFGIPSGLFFKPEENDPFRIKRFGQLLETPIGVAAGPHTQLAQNIVAAWLTGARYMELKTVQTLDELKVSRPCIDMQDEGYNCEWSQELKIKQSFEQYLDAWIIIHILQDKFGRQDNEPGMIFNMSVGYDFAGIMQENVQWFLSKMTDASEELNQKLLEIKDVYPRVTRLNINPQISDNITLSTMHGCPSGEIEKIGVYFLREKGLHTTIKLNPTLLGKEDLHAILRNSGFETEVPDLAFGHDLKYPEALRIIRNLKKLAGEKQLFFGLKLTNTLESSNHKETFLPNEEMMYMSGRALHPISVNLARKLQNEFNGKLEVSFSGGADAFNTPDLIACGLSPVTVSSDILKPGGYGRLHQYVEELRKAFALASGEAKDINDFTAKKSGLSHAGLTGQRLHNLNRYADKTLTEKRYKRTGLRAPDIKTARPLGYFDCIHAPCVDTCPTNQDIPDYMYHTAHGDFEKAFGVIMKTNPFPNTTGLVCDHLCETKCTRINYDSPVLIREIKRFVAEEAVRNHYEFLKNIAGKGKRAAIIGAGPSGLSCAYFLTLTGFDVNIYEAKSHPGGMVSGAIPSFRLTDEAVDIDIHRIEALGVKIHFSTKVDKQLFGRLREDNDFVYLAAGAQKSRPLMIEGANAGGVLDPLDFLFRVKEGLPTGIGRNVAVIGGGNTAMDAARTAFRLTGEEGKVTVIYRRTKQQMPADTGEIQAVMDEGMEIMELVSPVKINTRAGKVHSLTCVRMEPGEKDDSGRSRPVEIPDSEFEMAFDTIIPAIGQDLALDFVEASQLKTKPDSYETGIENVFIGGDALRGASTAINAIGDGRKAAKEMTEKAHLYPVTNVKPAREPLPVYAHMVSRSQKKEPVYLQETPQDNRKNFRLITATLTRGEAQKEASRCLLCDEVCNICTTVCPNLAFHSYETEPRQWSLQKITGNNGVYELTDDGDFRLGQKLQILHLADWCNQCGNCDTFCPTAGKPYLDKPHLYLKRESFEAGKDGYFFNEEKTRLEAYEQGEFVSLQEEGDGYIFQNRKIQVRLDKKSFRVTAVEIRGKTNFAVSLRTAAQMSVILEGARSFFATENS
ncbi:MAG: putative selenate reductase subunit YgfK [bacterium]|nr:MAG: putative selenate reductase subunit YgfK [bacterium]